MFIYILFIFTFDERGLRGWEAGGGIESERRWWRLNVKSETFSHKSFQRCLLSSTSSESFQIFSHRPRLIQVQATKMKTKTFSFGCEAWAAMDKGRMNAPVKSWKYASGKSIFSFSLSFASRFLSAVRKNIFRKAFQSSGKTSWKRVEGENFPRRSFFLIN